MPSGKRTRQPLPFKDKTQELLMKRTMTELKEEPDFFSWVTGASDLWTQTHMSTLAKENIWFILLINASWKAFPSPLTLDWKSYSSMLGGIQHPHSEIKCSSNSKRKDRGPELSWRKCFSAIREINSLGKKKNHNKTLTQNGRWHHNKSYLTDKLSLEAEKAPAQRIYCGRLCLWTSKL